MSARQKKILIVDNSPVVSSRLVQLLEGLPDIGCINYTASCLEAIKSLSSSSWDIVLMDIHFSDKPGIELLQLIRSIYPELRIIMISNESGSHYRKRCQTLGASCFLDKSTEFDRLPQLLSSML